MGEIHIIGHSFVRGLQTCITRSDVPPGKYESPFQPDFGMEDHEVRLFGWRPNNTKLAYVNHALEFVSSPLYGNYCMDPPYAVILHVGGNDVDNRDFDMGHFMSTLGELLMQLLRGNVYRIVVTALMPRRRRRSRFYDYEARRVEVNHAIHRMITGNLMFRPYCYFFQWDERRFTNAAWGKDGVHFCTWGMEKYYHQMRQAMILTRAMPFDVNRLSQVRHRPKRAPGYARRYRYEPY